MPMTSGNNYFPMSIADMRDVYGLMDDTRAPSSRSSPSTSSSSFSFSRMLRKKSRAVAIGETPVSAPTPTPSSSTRSSMDSQRTLTTPSSAVSASKPVHAPRDYEAALGALSSSYGFSGSVPASVPVVPAASTRTPRRKEARTRSPPSQMDEQTAHLGDLLSQYGTSSGPAVGGFRR